MSPYPCLVSSHPSTGSPSGRDVARPLGCPMRTAFLLGNPYLNRGYLPTNSWNVINGNPTGLQSNPLVVLKQHIDSRRRNDGNYSCCLAVRREKATFPSAVLEGHSALLKTLRFNLSGRRMLL
jgi:hypothetical protein